MIIVITKDEVIFNWMLACWRVDARGLSKVWILEAMLKQYLIFSYWVLPNPKNFVNALRGYKKDEMLRVFQKMGFC